MFIGLRTALYHAPNLLRQNHGIAPCWAFSLMLTSNFTSASRLEKLNLVSTQMPQIRREEMLA